MPLLLATAAATAAAVPLITTAFMAAPFVLGAAALGAATGATAAVIYRYRNLKKTKTVTPHQHPLDQSGKPFEAELPAPSVGLLPVCPVCNEHYAGIFEVCPTCDNPPTT